MICTCVQINGLLSLSSKDYRQIDHDLLFYWNISNRQNHKCGMIKYDYGFSDCQTKEEEELLSELYYTFFMEIRKDVLIFKKISILREGLDKLSLPYSLMQFFPCDYYSSIQSFFEKHPHILYNHRRNFE